MVCCSYCRFAPAAAVQFHLLELNVVGKLDVLQYFAVLEGPPLHECCFGEMDPLQLLATGELVGTDDLGGDEVDAIQVRAVAKDPAFEL